MAQKTLLTVVIGTCFWFSSCVNNNLPGPNCENLIVSFQNDIKPIIETNCLINNSSCHGMNPSLPNWAVFSEVQSRAATIKAKTQDRSMPKIGSLTQIQIDLIACWVDNGAKDN